ncbi:hypothetical protein Goklo_005156 [Gossypium klotzschianum]|uniref:Uncharacterized protein n=1 Tax=Gossypium klotzschianum TaxID=34286 RepID=A0A7J8VRL9_9ROSI|nr:hypothetical protein [Gossypium klotzschianum]
MPVGTVIRLLTKQGMVRCLGNLYGRIENLGNTYMQSLAKKDTLSKPMISNYAANNVPLFNLTNQRITLANQRSKGSSSAEGGNVERVVTYMVMNDLVVRPMSKISSITLLNKFKFQDVGVLEERKSLILKWTSLFYSCKLNFKNYAKQRANEDEALDDDANLDAPTTLSDLMFSDTKGYGGGGAVSVAARIKLVYMKQWQLHCSESSSCYTERI